MAKLDFETRMNLKREISRLRKAMLPKGARLTAGGKPVEGLEEGDARPWFPTIQHVPSAAHRILPSLDEYDQAA